MQRFSVPLFFPLAIAITWGIVLPGLAPDSPLNLVAIWGPGLAAIGITLVTEGGAGLRQLFKPLGQWRVGVQWYLVALFLPALIWLIARGIDLLLGQTYELTSLLASFGPNGAQMLPVLIIFSLPNALGEELGWRGFALPRLNIRYGPLIASLVIGFGWGLWHTAFWRSQGLSAEIPYLWFYLLAGSFVFTWLYLQSGGSLLITWLYHVATTATSYLLPPLPTLTDDVLIWLVAIALAYSFSRRAPG